MTVYETGDKVLITIFELMKEDKDIKSIKVSRNKKMKQTKVAIERYSEQEHKMG